MFISFLIFIHSYGAIIAMTIKNSSSFVKYILGKKLQIFKKNSYEFINFNKNHDVGCEKNCITPL